MADQPQERAGDRLDADDLTEIAQQPGGPEAENLPGSTGRQPSALSDW